jgi:hypothetical protein
MIVSIGLDNDRTVAVHSTSTGAKLGTGKIGKGVPIFSLSVGGDSYFCTGGKRFVKVMKRFAFIRIIMYRAHIYYTLGGCSSMFHPLILLIPTPHLSRLLVYSSGISLGRRAWRVS